VETRVKKWGREEWIANCKEYCGKLLYINLGGQSSVHYHKNKKETFYCLMGNVIFTVDGQEFDLKEPITIEPNTPHSFLGINQAVILEVSTHHDEGDVYRLTESYG